MTSSLVGLAIEQAPAAISLLKGLWKKRNPGAPEPTSEQVVAAYREAFKSSLAVDDAILAEHEPAAPAAPAGEGVV